MERPTLDQIRALPKVLLHDHLDGGLRPGTVIDLAAEIGHELPTTDVDELQDWFTAGAARKNLELYLETFAHTVGVMQTEEGLERVAAECAEDLAADGVVYAEVRFAPELSTRRGLTMDQVVNAVLAGFHQGSAGRNLTVYAICCAMRETPGSHRVAELTVRHRHQGVVAFDLAGPEHGYPPDEHLDAFYVLRRANHHITIHAGEGYGLPSIWKAIQWCGAERLGHGIRIVDDIDQSDLEPVLGELAAYVRDRRIPLEICPTSNVHSGAARSLAEHPVDLLDRLGFRVTISTDNRLMSNTSASEELHRLVTTFDYGWDHLERFTLNAAKSAFAPFPERTALIHEVLVPWFETARAGFGVDSAP